MEYLLVGTIVGTHGIKGELKVKSETSFPEQRYSHDSVLLIKKGNSYQEVKVTSHRVHKGLDLITLNDIKDINYVGEYIGLELYIQKSLLPDLEEDEFYFDDLIGLKVYDYQKEIGQVEDVMEVPQGAILIIRQINKKKSFVPFNEEFVKEVDLENKIIHIESIEGLLWE